LFNVFSPPAQLVGQSGTYLKGSYLGPLFIGFGMGCDWGFLIMAQLRFKPDYWLVFTLINFLPTDPGFGVADRWVVRPVGCLHKWGCLHRGGDKVQLKMNAWDIWSRPP